MGRSILAAVVGFVVWSVLWLGGNSLLSILTPGSFNEDGSTDSTLIFIILLVLSILFSLISGYLTARLATTSSTGPLLGLGIALLAVGLLVQIQFWALFPLWYSILFLALLIPATIVGGRAYRQRVG